MGLLSFLSKKQEEKKQEIEPDKIGKLFYRRTDKPDFDKERVLDKLVSGLPVTYGTFNLLKEFFDYFPQAREHIIKKYPDVEKTGMCIVLSECGNTSLIGKTREYYQLPIEYDYPILVLGAKYFDNDLQKDIIFFK
jgi:hypothetical protein